MRKSKRPTQPVRRAPPPPAKPARVSKKAARLVATAESLFKRYGIKRVSITEICAEADVSKVTFYKFFANKTELAKRIIDDLGDRNLARIDEIEARAVPFPDKVAALIEERVRLTREWSPEFMAELFHVEPEVQVLYAQRAARLRARYIDFIQHAQSSGGIRPEIHPDVALAVLDKLHELGADAELVRRAGGFENLTRAVHHTFFYGVLRD